MKYSRPVRRNSELKKDTHQIFELTTSTGHRWSRVDDDDDWLDETSGLVWSLDIGKLDLKAALRKSKSFGKLPTKDEFLEAYSHGAIEIIGSGYFWLNQELVYDKGLLFFADDHGLRDVDQTFNKIPYETVYVSKGV